MADSSAAADAVTGLPGRGVLEAELARMLSAAGGGRVAVLLVGLDEFAVVREALGFDAADEVLAAAARTIEAFFGDVRRVLALLPGDVFAVVLPGEHDAATVGERAESVIAALGRPSYVDGIGVGISASVGVFLAGTGPPPPAEVIRSAQIALRRARELGRTRWVLFDPVAGRADAARYRLACGIAGALESGQLEVVYRPHVVLPDAEIITSLNAVLRWRHPDFGQLRSEQFFPLAEATGMTGALGRHLLAEALRTAGHWRGRFGAAAPTVCLTLPRRMAIDEDLVRIVGRELDRNELQHRHLVLCTDVPSLLDDRGDLLGSLDELARAGVVFVVHITGLSELELLPALNVPAPGVMLTGAIIDALEVDEPPEQAVRTIRQVVERAEELGIKVGARGVLSEEHAELLYGIGVVVAAGPYLPTYSTAAEAETWVGRNFPIG
ncbi:EAL domain-containing protein [Amycolatopsis sp. Hca4]|uniref:EAL domain-containing protein n=1 Tax=Amycolatopsis sp. Hca4 TaxID=2742131 RepID=UPI00159001F6|nr:EAL domain-containing protein [Amycolatopsis sp. Hca4]QKV73822.1 EAL domain-containing protein [Amycolatopsis sp. Hca4]